MSRQLQLHTQTLSIRSYIAASNLYYRAAQLSYNPYTVAVTANVGDFVINRYLGGQPVTFGGVAGSYVNVKYSPYDYELSYLKDISN